MKAMITIQMDNAAFEDKGRELARIFQKLADRVYGYQTMSTMLMGLYDINGNYVGEFKVIK